jgi:DNA-binding MarR family transcriptional regulator
MSNSGPRRKTDFERNGAKSPTLLEVRFAEAQSRLGPHRQQLIRTILDNCEETCFLSSRELAKRYHVDAATVVRTVQALGYKGFAEFSGDLRQHLMARITPYTVLKAATREKERSRSHRSQPGQGIGESQCTESQPRSESGCRAGQAYSPFATAHHRLSVSTSRPHWPNTSHMAWLPAALTHRHLPEAKGICTTKSNSDIQRPLSLPSGFGQCLRVTVEAVLRANKQGVATFGITDSDTTPIARYCDAHWLPVSSVHHFSIRTSPMV